jgi:hypothetical protein
MLWPQPFLLEYSPELPESPDVSFTRLQLDFIPRKEDPRRAVAEFVDIDGVEGTIQFVQASASHPLLIIVDIRGLKKRAGGYHIHQFAPRARGCGADSTGGHYANAGGLDIGSFSDKYGSLSGLDRINDAFSDPDLTLYGPTSIVGRSVVIHSDRLGDRWLCTGIVAQDVVMQNDHGESSNVLGFHLVYDDQCPRGDSTQWGLLPRFEALVHKTFERYCGILQTSLHIHESGDVQKQADSSEPVDVGVDGESLLGAEDVLLIQALYVKVAMPCLEEDGQKLSDPSSLRVTPSFRDDESYNLGVQSPSTVLTVGSTAGVFRGIETFSQMWSGGVAPVVPNSVRKAGRHGQEDNFGADLKAGRHGQEGNFGTDLIANIFDRPQFPWRGLLVDVSRHFMPMSTLKRMCDAMAINKLNVFHLHLSDAVSFPAVFDGVSEIGLKGGWTFSDSPQDRATYSQSDLQDLVAHASSHGIRIVPELDVPSHVGSWRHAYPDIVVNCSRHFAYRAKTQGQGDLKAMDTFPLDPSKEETYEVIERLLSALASVFPDEYIHLGGDEVDYDCWHEDEQLTEWALSKGYSKSASTRAHQMFQYFEARVLAMGLKHGKKIVLWQEAITNTGSGAYYGEPPEATITYPWSNGQSTNQSLVVQLWYCWGDFGSAPMRAALSRGMGVLSSACWYLDWDAQWENYYHNDHFMDKRTDALRAETPDAFWGGEGM